MKDFQKRVVEEAKELADKVDKLCMFAGTQAFAELDEYEQELLAKQYRHMKVYLNVLKQRIENFNQD